MITVRFSCLACLAWVLWASGCAAVPCDDDSAGATAAECDVDDDGFWAIGHACDGDDCDDSNPDVHPFAPDQPGEGVDWDCDGEQT